MRRRLGLARRGRLAGLALMLCTVAPLARDGAAAGRPHAPPDRAACLSAGGSAAIPPAAGGVPASRRLRLARGVTVSDLFGANGDPAVETTFRTLRSAGFGHVRIPVSPLVFAPSPPAWQADVLRQLDRAVCAAVAADLGVIIDLHPFELLEPVGGTPAAISGRLAAVWRKLAARYAAASAELVFFEVLNEPKLADERQWETMQAAAVQAIRSVALANTVIATASPWSTAAALAALRPLADRDVAYAFHFYTPMIFTHQSAAWSLPSYATVRGLDFPARAGNVAKVARGVAPPLQPALADYAAGFANDARLAEELDLAARWGRAHDATVVATEFGVFDGAAPARSRAAWLAAVRRGFEDRRIGWTLWEYRGGFGIEGDLRRGCAAADSAVRALALCGT